MRRSSLVGRYVGDPFDFIRSAALNSAAKAYNKPLIPTLLVTAVAVVARWSSLPAAVIAVEVCESVLSPLTASARAAPSVHMAHLFQ